MYISHNTPRNITQYFFPIKLYLYFFKLIIKVDILWNAVIKLVCSFDWGNKTWLAPPHKSSLSAHPGLLITLVRPHSSLRRTKIIWTQHIKKNHLKYWRCQLFNNFSHICLTKLIFTCFLLFSTSSVWSVTRMRLNWTNWNVRVKSCWRTTLRLTYLFLTRDWHRLS